MFRKNKKIKNSLLDGVNFSIIFLISYLIIVPLYPFVYGASIELREEKSIEENYNNKINKETVIEQIESNKILASEKEEGVFQDEPVVLVSKEKQILSGLNKINIKKIGVDGEIVVTDDEDKGLENGFWMYPTSVDPGRVGNFILSGHRYKYLPPHNTTFYHLDKMQNGDEILIEWNNVMYKYVVREVKVVPDNERKVIKQTDNKTITLITCHPLFSSEKRLIVVGELLEMDSDGDGLFDSDEIYVYKTDPYNIDTDGDGYSDGVEVKNGYNPLGEGRL